MTPVELLMLAQLSEEQGSDAGFPQEVTELKK